MRVEWYGPRSQHSQDVDFDLASPISLGFDSDGVVTCGLTRNFDPAGSLLVSQVFR